MLYQRGTRYISPPSRVVLIYRGDITNLHPPLSPKSHAKPAEFSRAWGYVEGNHHNIPMPKPQEIRHFRWLPDHVLVPGLGAYRRRSAPTMYFVGLILGNTVTLA
jgi:hypothetical protein